MLPDKKILVKGGPKQYKTKAGLSGGQRLYHQLFRMRQTAQRAAQRPDADALTIALSDELNRTLVNLARHLSTSLNRHLKQEDVIIP